MMPNFEESKEILSVNFIDACIGKNWHLKTNYQNEALLVCF